MNKQGRLVRTLISVFAVLMLVPAIVVAGDSSISTVALSGYDPVSYFGPDGPQRGSGFYPVEFGGAVYLFVNEENKAAFEKNPQKYLPQFGGYCAYGVAIGKKFQTDPFAYEVIDGKLYLNLDKQIQAKWNQDKPKYIQDADRNWKQIKDKKPSEL